MSEAKDTSAQTAIYTAEEHGERIRSFLRMVIEKGNFDLDFTVGPPLRHDPGFDRPDLAVDFSGEDTDLLLANKGELLLALEMLTLEVLRVPSDHHSRIAFDCNGYRLLRMQELRLTAVTAADRAVQTNKPFAFNPLNSRERRALHIALRDRTDVRSESASSQHGRYVVIYPAAMKTPEVPPPPPGPFLPRGGRPEGGASRGHGDERRGHGDDRRPPRRDGSRGEGGRGDRPPRRGPRGPRN